MSTVTAPPAGKPPRGPTTLIPWATSAGGRLVILGLVGLGTGAVTRLAGARPVGAVLAAGVGLAGLLRWWPGSAIGLLLVTVALNRFTFPVGTATGKPEHVAALLVAGVLALRWAGATWAGRQEAPAAADGLAARLAPPGRLGAVAVSCLLVYLALNLLSSLLNAPDPQGSVREVGLVALVCLPYFLLPALIRTPRALQGTILLWLGLAAAEAVCGIAIMILYRQGIDLGVQITIGSPPVPLGTMREGNIFGSYTAMGAVACLTFVLSSSRARTLLAATAAGTLTLGGAVISLARGAWLGLAAGAVLVLALRLRTAARRGAGLALLAVALLPLLLAFAGTPFLDEVGFYVQERLTTLNPDTILNDGTVAERLDTYAKAEEGIAVHPWIGNGTGSFGQRYYYRSVAAPAWVGNLELHLLYDTGLLGCLAFFGCLAATAATAVRAYRQCVAPEWRAALLALAAGLAVLLVAYQATEATWLAFTWAHLGLLAAAARVVPRAAAGDGGAADRARADGPPPPNRGTLTAEGAAGHSPVRRQPFQPPG